MNNGAGNGTTYFLLLHPPSWWLTGRPIRRLPPQTLRRFLLCFHVLIPLSEVEGGKQAVNQVLF